MVQRFGRPLTVFDLASLAGQFREALAAAEREARATGVTGVILDTDLRLSVVYARHYLGACPGWLQETAGAFAADLQILCRPDFPFVHESGQRGTPQDQERVQESIAALLEGGKTPVLAVEGSAADRLTRIVAYLTERYPDETWPPANPD